MRTLVPLAILLAACARRVETTSHPVHVQLRFTNTCNGELRQHVGAGRTEPIEIVDSTATLDVPGMRGGYTEWGGATLNVHDPMTYPVVVLVDGGRTLVELSLQQIRALPRDPDGFSLVDVRC